jgi:hypothetical protein
MFSVFLDRKYQAKIFVEYVIDEAEDFGYNKNE